MARSIRSKQDFLQYLSAFNRSEHEAYTAYYAPNMEMGLGAFTLKGKDAILGFFQQARQRILEHVDPVNILLTEKAVAITANITFTTLVDFEEPFFDIGPPISKGGKYIAPFVVYYALDEQGQMLTISAGRSAPAQVIPPPGVKTSL